MATIVIRSYSKELITGAGCFEWSVTKARRCADGELYMHSMLVTKTKARELIDKLGLVESYSTPDGEIFDTPDGEFKKLFPNGIRSNKEKLMIEKVDNL